MIGKGTGKEKTRELNLISSSLRRISASTTSVLSIQGTMSTQSYKVCRTFNTTKCTVRPGQFKQDHFLITNGVLGSVIKQTIYAANIYKYGREDL